MKPVVFDAEANGLFPDRFHCLCTNGELATTSYDEMREFLTSTEVLVGHNIIRWDIVHLERVLGIKVKARLIDTLAISWYLEPERIRHGLESYGEEFGVLKPHIADWDSLTIEEYIHRCKRDVEINSILWDRQWKTLLDLYGSEKEAMRFLAYLSFKMDCAREQEQVGWRLDVNRARNSLQLLSSERDQKLVELTEAMPKVPVWATKRKPAKPYKMNGSLSKAGEEWQTFCEERGVSPDSVEHVYLKDHEEPNPRSVPQIKAWFESLGWKPETFKYNRNKETGEVKEIPQISQDKTIGPGLCPSVLKLVNKEPKIAVLDGLFILNHRIAILEGFLEDADDEGYLKAEVDGLTNTLRFQHRTIVNLPGVDRAYGEHIRGCLIAPEGKELCGSDMSGLEDRLKQHYIYPYDPDYVKEMNSDDFDPHLDLAVNAGAVSSGDAQTYKQAEKKDGGIKSIRHTYKQGNYACQYGAGVPRLALTIGCSRDVAERIHTTYWKRNWAIRQAASDAEVRASNGRMWLYNPISRFWYSLRSDKDRFSTLVQGSAVYCFDTWVKYVRRGGPKVCGQFHDEIVIPVHCGQRDRLQQHLRLAIERVNEELKLNRELDIDIQWGDNYAAIH